MEYGSHLNANAEILTGENITMSLPVEPVSTARAAKCDDGLILLEDAVYFKDRLIFTYDRPQRFFVSPFPSQ